LVFGNFLGKALGTLIGGVGGLLLLSSLMLITLIIAFDIKIEKIFVWLASLFARTKETAEETINEAKMSGKEKDNLEKIKDLRERKKKTILPVGEIKADEQTSELTDEQKEETTIRIIRKDEPSPTKTEILQPSVNVADISLGDLP